MANPPRKPGSRPASPDRPDATDDLFSQPAAAADSPVDEWTLDEPAAPQPVRPRHQVTLPTQPMAPSQASFESNPHAVPAEIPAAILPPAAAATTAVPTPPPASGPVAAPSPAKAPLAVVDPFQIEDELPAAAPAKTAEGPAPRSSFAARSNFEEEEAPPVAEVSAEPAAAAKKRFDKAGLLVAMVILTTLAAVFGSVLYTNRPTAVERHSDHGPDLPLKGQVATLTEAASGWRPRQAADRVSMVDVTFPPSRQEPALLPQVKFTLDAGATKTGFLRFLFLDPDGKISGDVRVVKLSGGTIDPLSSGATVNGPGQATVYGSLGFMDRPAFLGYASDDVPRWSVEVSESTDYSARSDGWTKLATFDILNTTDP